MTRWQAVEQLNMPDTTADNIIYGSDRPGYHLMPEVIDRLRAACAVRATWEAGYTAAQLNGQPHGRIIAQLQRNEATIAELTARVVELEATLDPFAEMSPIYDASVSAAAMLHGFSGDEWRKVTVGDFRRAAAALHKPDTG